MKNVSLLLALLLSFTCALPLTAETKPVADFNALVEDLTGALDKFKVGDKEKSDLLGALGPMKKDIVER